MFVTRLVAATIATIVFVMVVLWVTAPDGPRTTSSGFGPAEPARPISTQALFVLHCAQCHGKTGDGDGTTELERPARSFRAGGFAYGNSLRTVMRTLEFGIPGTAMPAFGESLSVQQRSALARHVIDLGPPGTDVPRKAGVLHVEERPLVVHGMLADPGGGGRRDTRSVVIGFPNGATLQYRHSGAALLAIRQGDFLDRADWIGHGEPLRALGEVEWVADEEVRERRDFVRAANGAGLVRALRRTATTADEVVLTFDLRDADGATLGRGEERVSFAEAKGGPIAVRTIRVLDAGGGVALAPLENAKRVGSFQTRKFADGLVAASPVDQGDVRIYAHTKRWSAGLATALERSLERLP